MWLNLLADAIQIQDQRLRVVDPFLLGLDREAWGPLTRFYQQSHQVLPKDIPAVLLKEPLTHFFITEG